MAKRDSKSSLGQLPSPFPLLSAFCHLPIPSEFPAMAKPPAPGSVIVPDWHESAEGKEYLACILRKNRRRVFGKCPPPQPVTCHSLGRTVSPVTPSGEQRSRAVRACCTVPCPHPQISLELIPSSEPGNRQNPARSYYHQRGC